VLLEPIPATRAFYFPRQDFLAILREECTKQGALLIFDEVMTAFVSPAAERRKFTESHPI